MVAGPFRPSEQGIDCAAYKLKIPQGLREGFCEGILETRLPEKYQSGGIRRLCLCRPGNSPERSGMVHDRTHMFKYQKNGICQRFEGSGSTFRHLSP